MKSLPIICYHGSPGVPDEFMLLEKYMPERRIIKIVRSGYGINNKSALEKSTGDVILLGYSWGAMDAINDAAKSIERIKGVILVAPYLFVEHKPSRLKRVILSTPVLSYLILVATGKKAIGKMLIKTSSPFSVPLAYQQVAPRLASPKMLRRAALEKDVNQGDLQASLKCLNSRGVPIAVIWGDEDRISKVTEQIDPLRSYTIFKLESQLPHTGHAIVWTCPKKLARFVDDFLNKIENGERS